ncbi:MAG: SRPBCC family protein [Verrucomicrobiota bacterium]
MLPILLALAFIAILLIIVIAGQPDEFMVTRTTNISAPPEKVFPQVNDFHKWEACSPWAKMDPACKNVFGGAPAGTGATFSWAGNKKVGEGSMTILASRPSDLIQIKLEFLKPFKATNTAAFAFQPAGSQTTVTWSMTGKSNFFFKIFGLFMNCDKMVGKDFEKGLASLKSVAESAAK